MTKYQKIAALRRRGHGVQQDHLLGPAAPKPTVVLELRPALDGFAGIPQETRLLFKCLKGLDAVKTQGLLQHSNRILVQAVPVGKSRCRQRKYYQARRLNKLSRFIVSFGERPFYTAFDKISEFFSKQAMGYKLFIKTLIGSNAVKLNLFDPTPFKDFVWRTIFFEDAYV